MAQDPQPRPSYNKTWREPGQRISFFAPTCSKGKVSAYVLIIVLVFAHVFYNSVIFRLEFYPSIKL
jgi:hypothetical protein